ncbi:MAG: class I SAM-dependent methyltransferase, partial [Rhodocyclaceae bacterium]|nr:class I SAM-dependent methyltransferase [Rhodocyclaceae bacterium]
MTELADVEFALCWHDARANHCDRRFVAGVAPAGDHLAGIPLAPLLGAAPGATITLNQGLLPGPTRAQQRVVMRRADWPARFAGMAIAPRLGRWYPRQLLAAIPAIPAGSSPLRVVASAGDDISVDLAPPLAIIDVTIEGRVRARSQGTAPAPRDLLPLVADNGPGLQAALPDAATDFLAGDALARSDATADADFYAYPRLVDHLDTTALAELAALHARFLHPGQQVLDLMASANSHLPANAPALTVVGLGMNAAELAANPHLAERIVHDLNTAPELPCASGRFDLVLCALSVEYLIHPVEVFREVARVLKPGGIFLVTFSERWFPPKAITLWGELHPFERMGLALDYFRRSGDFVDLATESLRGRPRPPDDKYYRKTKNADPIYAVRGTARCQQAEKGPS